MTDNRDICERLECPSYDGAIFMRLDAAKEIRYLRHYVARLEGDLVEVEIGLEKTVIKLENDVEFLRRHSSRQALDIVTLGQEVGRLREALEKIATIQGGGDCCSVYEGFVYAKRISRAALAEKENK